MTSSLDYNNSLKLRRAMVADQLLRRGIHEKRLLQAFQEIPRHIFVSNVRLEKAYSDFPLPIKAGQTISQPYVVAIMLSYLQVDQVHNVLEIGSGSGYATALLSKLANQVDAMEVYGELVSDSKLALDQISVTNVTLSHGSAWEQLEGDKVYDRIVLWASPPRVPSHLFDSLGEGGILVAPEGKAEQYVWVFRKQRGQLKRERKDAVRFVPLVQGTRAEIDRTS